MRDESAPRPDADLRRAMARFATAIEASRVAVFNQDLELRYTWIHHPALGLAAADVIGKRDVDVFERLADATRIEALKRAALTTGTAQRQEVPVWHDGVERWFDLSVEPERDASGVITGVTCAAMDITDHKHAESDLAFLAAVNDALTPAASPGEVAATSARLVAEHFHLARCVLVEIDVEADTAAVFHDHSRLGQASVIGRYRLADFHTAHEREQLQRGHAVVVDDLSRDRDASQVEACAAQGVGALINAPYLSDGRLQFVLSAVHATPHAWRRSKSRLLQEVAARIYLRLERARADEALKAAHDTFHHLVDQSPFGIYVVNADFRLVQVSAGAQKVFAQVRPLLGRDFTEVLRQLWEEPFASDTIAIFQRTLATGEPYHAPTTVERRNDIDAVEAYDWKVERIILPDGRFGVVCHFYDLSERQRYEAALREADRQKDEFLAMLAHELRNPLAPIRTAAGVLRLIAPDVPAIASCRDTIERQAAQMARLLDDLLDVSRLSGGRLVIERHPVRLDEVLAAAVETSRPALHEQRQRLTTTGLGGLVVHGDSVRLTQVFANLLNNAAKFSPAGSDVEMHVSAGLGTAVVTVRDHGIGIAPEWRERVFDLFAQEPHGTTLGAGGLGIGLSLTRRLVELHDGQIAVTSDGRGQGSAFTVTLPVTTTGTLDVAVPALPPAAPLPRPRILIVDDNRDAADVTALLLDAEGCDVRTAYDGPAAVETADEFQPRLVLLDLGLPGIDGFEVCRRLRAAPWSRALTAIAISGWARPQDRERSLAAGFDHHLMKPVAPDELVTLIRVVLAAP